MCRAEGADIGQASHFVLLHNVHTQPITILSFLASCIIYDMSSGRQNDTNGVVVISIVENRAREICVAEIDSRNISTVDVHILLDNHSYSQVVSLIHLISPHEILLADNCRNKVLSQRIIEEFVTKADTCRVLFISRQYFDQDRGAEMLKKVVVGEVDADLISKYIVLAGLHCLLRYIENTTGSVFCHNSLRLILCYLIEETSIQHYSIAGFSMVLVGWSEC